MGAGLEIVKYCPSTSKGLHSVGRPSNNCGKHSNKKLVYRREIARVGSHYTVQYNSRSPILVSIESPYVTSFYCELDRVASTKS